MSHLLHEVKDELDWATLEVAKVEQKYANAEAEIKKNGGKGVPTTEVLEELKIRRKSHRLDELYSILGRAAQRYALLSRMYEIGSKYSATEDIVTALTDGMLFRLTETSENCDNIIFQLSDAMQCYFHDHLDNEADEGMRAAWLKVEHALRDLGRNI